MSQAVSSAADRGREAARMLVALAWVLGATAASLALLGAVPGWIAGESDEVRRVATVDEAARRLGVPLALPSYFPSRLAWPPAEIRLVAAEGGGVAMRLRPRLGPGPELELIQAASAGSPIPAALLGEVTELGRSRALVGARPAVRARVVVDGSTWEELRWERDGRAMVLRSQGDVEELLALARSTHARGTQ
jgi:hypothetical protein